jgi:hypothetical protein
MNKSAMIASFFTVLVALGAVSIALGSVIRCQRSGTRSSAQIARKLAAPAF